MSYNYPFPSMFIAPPFSALAANCPHKPHLPVKPNARGVEVESYFLPGSVQFLAVWVPFTVAISFLFLQVSGRTYLLAEAVLCPGLEKKSQRPLGQCGGCILEITLHICASLCQQQPCFTRATCREWYNDWENITCLHTINLFPRSISLFLVLDGSACDLTLAKIMRPLRCNKGFR